MRNEQNVQTYMGYMWLQVDGEHVTVGLTEEGLDEFESVLAVDLPSEDDEVMADEVCGSIETEDGPLDLYFPVDGKVIEVNSPVLENPSVIKDDPGGDGWLFKVEIYNPDDLSIALTDGDD